MSNATRQNRRAQPSRTVLVSLRNEIAVSARLLADNVWGVTVPAIVFAITSSHVSQSEQGAEIRLVLAILWAFLMTYAFDTANQAVGVDEDRINKPWRPIPRGIATPVGMWWRSYLSSALFIGIAFTGGLPAVGASILYVAFIVFVNCLASQRYYRFWKPVVMYISVVCQIVGSWAIAGPFHQEVFYVAVICACVFGIPSPIEDARDAEGDRKQGRVTFATLYGPGPIGTYFAITISCVPLLGALVLWQNHAFFVWPLVLLATVCLMSVIAAVVTLRARTNTAYRRAFQLCSLVHVVFSVFYCAILW